MDAEAPLRVPPTAAELQWGWLADRKLLACTRFDEDLDPYLVEIRPHLTPAIVRWLLMHELSHMRNPAANCSKRDRWWRAEALRLAQLGAFSREEVF